MNMLTLLYVAMPIAAAIAILTFRRDRPVSIMPDEDPVLPKAKLRQINVARDFTTRPAGRLRAHGPGSGEQFREEHLIPALREAHFVMIQMDGTMGYGSSWLKAVFSHLGAEGFDGQDLLQRIHIASFDRSITLEIKQYLADDGNYDDEVTPEQIESIRAYVRSKNGGKDPVITEYIHPPGW
jgi:hypothetical protein